MAHLQRSLILELTISSTLSTMVMVSSSIRVVSLRSFIGKIRIFPIPVYLSYIKMGSHDCCPDGQSPYSRSETEFGLPFRPWHVMTPMHRELPASP